MLPIFVLLVCIGAASPIPETGKTHDVQEIPSKPGLHFERLGNLQYYLSEWTLISFVSLDGLEKEFQVINTGLQRLEKACDNPGFSYNNYFLNFTVCTNDLRMLRIHFNEISKSRLVVQSLVDHRQKRGLIDAVGSVQKFLFGTLDADDGTYYDSQLRLVTDNLDDSLTLIQEQSQIVRSCVERFNNTIQDAQFNEQLLANKTKELVQEASFVKQKLSTLAAEQLIDECASRLMYLISKYRSDVESLTDSILFAKFGSLHPHVIAPNDLIDSLCQAVPKLPHGTSFPVPLDHGQAHNILNMLRLTVYFSAGNLVFLINVPLVRPTTYEYYQVSPLPFLIENNTYGYIKPEEPYFLVDPTHVEFSVMSDFELTKCYKNDNGRDVVCKGINPLLPTSSSTLCTASMFYLPTRLPLSCETRILNIRSALWQPLATGNQWIYCLNNPVKITLQCPRKGSQEITLRDIGIITIFSPCTGFSPNYILLPKQTTSTQLIHTTFIPNFNITVEPDLLDRLRALNFSSRLPSTSVPLRTLRTENLDLFSLRLDEITRKAEDIHFRNKLQIRSSSYFYALICGGVIITLLVLWKFRRFCVTSDRTSSNETVINFNAASQKLLLEPITQIDQRDQPDKLPCPPPRVRLPEETPQGKLEEGKTRNPPARRNLLFPVSP